MYLQNLMHFAKSISFCKFEVYLQNRSLDTNILSYMATIGHHSAVTVLHQNDIITIFNMRNAATNVKQYQISCLQCRPRAIITSLLTLIYGSVYLFN